MGWEQAGDSGGAGNTVFLDRDANCTGTFML